MTQSRSRGDYPLVEVTWVDSSETSGWQQDIITKPLVCMTAGYMVHSGRRSVVVAMNRSEKRSAHSFGTAMTIPRGCVKRVRRLR